MKILMFFLLVCSLSMCLTEATSCEETLADSCIRGDFPGAVAHGIHSLNLQELQYFFDKSATDNNSIPIVNFNLSSPDLVLPSVPDLNLNNTFLTPSMNSVDHILSNWENENFFMKNASIIEMLVHNLHMYETLSVSGRMFKRLKRKIKKNKDGIQEKIEDICNCMKEEDDEIWNILNHMANSMRNSDGNFLHL